MELTKNPFILALRVVYRLKMKWRSRFPGFNVKCYDGAIEPRDVHPLRRLDCLFHRLKGKTVYWSECDCYERTLPGCGRGVPYHFPRKAYVWLNNVSNGPRFVPSLVRLCIY